MIPITLQQTIVWLEGVAREAHAEITTLIQLELGGGATLYVHWEDDTIPREAHLLFGERDGAQDTYLWSWVLCPHRYLAALDEGLSEEIASSECRRMVESLTDTALYLRGEPYEWVRPKG